MGSLCSAEEEEEHEEVVHQDGGEEPSFSPGFVNHPYICANNSASGLPATAEGAKPGGAEFGLAARGAPHCWHQHSEQRTGFQNRPYKFVNVNNHVTKDPNVFSEKEFANFEIHQDPPRFASKLGTPTARPAKEAREQGIFKSPQWQKLAEEANSWWASLDEADKKAKAEALFGKHLFGAIPQKEDPPGSEHYRTLGLRPGAPAPEVRKAYRQLALKLHPDKQTKDSDGAHFKKVTAAYKAICEIRES